MVDGIGAVDVGAEQIVLHDAAGTPAFCCKAGSAVLEAARAARPAVLRVTTIALPDAPTSAVFLGRLAISSDEQVDTVGVVSLLLATVLLEWDAPGRDGLSHGGPPTRSHEVPLAIYAATAPLSPATGEALRAHTNSAHADRLRDVVATTTRLPPRRSPARACRGSTSTGAEIEWVDTGGAHRGRLRFPHAARDHCDLVSLLRTALDDQHLRLDQFGSDGTTR